METSLQSFVGKALLRQNKIDLLTTLWALRATARRAFTDAVVAQETAKDTC